MSQQLANQIAAYKVQDDDALALTAARTLSVTERVVRCSCATATGNYTIKLPNVSEAVGLIFSVVCTSAADGKAVTLADNDSESEDWSNLTLDTTDDGALLYSDGRKWWIITNDIA